MFPAGDAFGPTVYAVTHGVLVPAGGVLRILERSPARLGSAALRVVEANRLSFDSIATVPGALEGRVQALEAELAAVRLDAAEARHSLAVFQTSTSWRLTRPVRWAVDVLHGGRTRPPFAADVPPSPARPPPLSYRQWIETEEATQFAALRRSGPGHQPQRPQRLGLVVLGAGPAANGIECPDGCTVLVLDQPEAQRAVRRALDQLDVDLVCFLDGGDRLAPGALSLAAQVLAQYPQVDLLFADEDWLDGDGGRVRPFFKPGWDPELQRGRDLVGPFAFYRTALVRQAALSCGPAWRYDLANQVAAATWPDRIRHVPAVLCHRAALPAGHAEAMRAAMATQLQRSATAGEVVPVPRQPGLHRVVYGLPRPEPLVSIIIPTRDRADLLRPCIDGILNRTDYPRMQVLLVDNGTVAPDALALLDRLALDDRVEVLRRPGPFNWSALNNAAASEARGDVLLLLNNDIVVLQPDWLTVLVSHVVQPGVGAVGAKLLYPDGRVQHAGLTTDATGVPRHVFRYAPGTAAGAFDLLGVAREVWGVTGACLATRRDVFFELGGLNEALPVAYNDVDFCLRLTACGYRILWTPWSLLEHRELASRAPDHSAARQAAVHEERSRLLRDWGGLALRDPFLNPNLRLVDEHPCLCRTA